MSNRSRAGLILSLMQRVYRDVTDLQGVPYVDHLRAVADDAGVKVGTSGWIVGMVHDAVEDGKTTFSVLKELLTEDELIALGLLTRRKDQTYAEYIAVLLRTPGPPGLIARGVKRADLAHNLGRITPEIRKSHPDLEARYSEALLTLGVEELEMITS